MVLKIGVQELAVFYSLGEGVFKNGRDILGWSQGTEGRETIVPLGLVILVGTLHLVLMAQALMSWGWGCGGLQNGDLCS